MKLQMKISKILCLVVLITCAINFIFSLGLTTDIYHLYLAKSFDALSGVKLSGTGLFKEIQPFNTSFVDACIAMIIVAVFLFVTKTNSRRKYYISNYISTAASVLCNIGVSVWAIINIASYRSRYLNETDFELYLKYANEYGAKYTESTFWFDINIILLILNIVVTLGLVVNLILKISLMKAEDRLLNGGTVNE